MFQIEEDMAVPRVIDPSHRLGAFRIDRVGLMYLVMGRRGIVIKTYRHLWERMDTGNMTTRHIRRYVDVIE